MRAGVTSPSPLRDRGKTCLLIAAPLFLIAAYYLAKLLFPAERPILIALPLVMLFVFGALLLPRRMIRDAEPLPILGLFALLAAALLLRLTLFSFQTDDYGSFLGRWIGIAGDMKGFSALGETIGDYNAPYFYILWIIAKVSDKLSIGLRLPYVKLISVAFDLIAARYGMLLSARLSGGKKLPTAVFFIILLLPTVAANSAMWGQCDSIYTALCLAGLYYGLKKQSVKSFLFFSLAFSFKLQTVFLLPMLLVLLFSKRIRWRDAWVFPAVFMLLLAPALAMGRPFLETVSVYLGQAQEYHALSLYAPGVFGFVPDSHNVTSALAADLGLLAAATYLLAVLFYLFLRRDRLSDDALILAALAMAIGIPFFLPHMHERYFYAADLIAVIAASKKRSRMPIPVLTALSSMLAYVPYLYRLNEAPIPMPILSAMMLSALVLTLRELVHTVENQEPEIRL